MSYGFTKRGLQVTRAVLRSRLLVSIGPDSYTTLVDQKGRKQAINNNIVQIIEQAPFKWTVLVAVMGRDEFKQEYIKTITVNSPQPVSRDQIVEQVGALHKDLVDGIPEKHFVNVGWVGAFDDLEFDEAKVFDFFKKYKAFDLLAGWELDNAA